MDASKKPDLREALDIAQQVYEEIYDTALASQVTSATWPNLRKYLPKSQELCRNAGLTLLAFSIVRNGSTHD
jgi:hypothetical protein